VVKTTIIGGKKVIFHLLSQSDRYAGRKGTEGRRMGKRKRGSSQKKCLGRSQSFLIQIIKEGEAPTKSGGKERTRGEYAIIGLANPGFQEIRMLA